MTKEVVLITGGARSGKSTFALSLAEKKSGRKYFLATAEPSDDEMTERIRRHREERGNSWTTIEEPVDIARVISESDSEGTLIVVDCITVWLSNMILNRLSDVTNDNSLHEKDVKDVETAVSGLIETLSDLKSSSVYIVTNEVGMGIVPGNSLARLFRDIAGRVNQRLAEVADCVFLMVSGIPVRIK